MKKDFLIVSRKILPDYLDKVIYARNLLTSFHNYRSCTKSRHFKKYILQIQRLCL